jgi:hypothetical protein
MALALRWRPGVDFLLFQAFWFSATFGAVGGVGSWVVLFAAIAVAAHLVLCSDAGLRRRELRTILIVGAIGAASDVVATYLGLFRFGADQLSPLGLPLWMWSLWLCFPIMLGTTLRWLANRPWLALALGAVGGPLSYFAGVRIGALEMVPPEYLAYSWVGIVWGAFTPFALSVHSAWLPGATRW